MNKLEAFKDGFDRFCKEAGIDPDQLMAKLAAETKESSGGNGSMTPTVQNGLLHDDGKIGRAHV